MKNIIWSLPLTGRGLGGGVGRAEMRKKMIKIMQTLLSDRQFYCVIVDKGGAWINCHAWKSRQNRTIKSFQFKSPPIVRTLWTRQAYIFSLFYFKTQKCSYLLLLLFFLLQPLLVFHIFFFFFFFNFCVGLWNTYSLTYKSDHYSGLKSL